MGVPRSTGEISFPASAIDDEIRKYLEEHYGIDPGGKESALELFGADTETEEGIFSINDSEAPYGEFPDLEDLLVKKGIPFDRRSYMDWNRPPVLRVFRPWNLSPGSDPPVDLCISLDTDGDEPVVSVVKIREILDRTDTEEGPEENLRDYLDFNFPSYPPLADFVKEAQDEQR